MSHQLESEYAQAMRGARLRTPYRRYDVLAKWDTPSWNEATRQVVADRLHHIPQRRFFTEREWAVLEAAQARLIPQPDREEPIPITAWVDDRLHRGQGDGYRFQNMPPMEEAWRLGLAALDEEARAMHGQGFPELDPDSQDDVLERVQKGEVETRAWGAMPPERFFSHELLDGVVIVYYAHPDSWSEIGFGGPASPRGYVRLDKRDPWEAKAVWD
jgi:hypothetical protein